MTSDSALTRAPPPPFAGAAAFPSLGGPPAPAQNGVKPGAPTVASVVAAGVQKRPVGPAAAPAPPGGAPSPHASLDGSSGEEARLAAETALDSLATQLRAMGLQDSPPSLTPAQSLQVLQQCAARSVPQPADTQWQSVPQRPRPPPVPIPASYPAQVGCRRCSAPARPARAALPCAAPLHGKPAWLHAAACPSSPPAPRPPPCSAPPSSTPPRCTRSWTRRRSSSSSTTSPGRTSSTWRRGSSSGRPGASTSSTRLGSRWGVSVEGCGVWGGRRVVRWWVGGCQVARMTRGLGQRDPEARAASVPAPPCPPPPPPVAQRHEEPKAGGQPGDDWEQGTYVYFDSTLQDQAGGVGGRGGPWRWLGGGTSTATCLPWALTTACWAADLRRQRLLLPLEAILHLPLRPAGRRGLRRGTAVLC
jgi:hypothetical protein